MQSGFERKDLLGVKERIAGQGVALVTIAEHRLLGRLAAKGKPTRLAHGEVEAAKSLERDGYVFMVGSIAAIITPRGRHLLAGDEQPKKPDKKQPPTLLE